jgi:hypothetical protein
VKKGKDVFAASPEQTVPPSEENHEYQYNAKEKAESPYKNHIRFFPFLKICLYSPVNCILPYKQKQGKSQMPIPAGDPSTSSG